jgi:hypothetical protein
MKGRVYDPVARSFLTPDPFVVDPLFSQSYNRYSYVYNNPATLIDPSGFDPECGPRCRNEKDTPPPPAKWPPPSAHVFGGYRGGSTNVNPHGLPNIGAGGVYGDIREHGSTDDDNGKAPPPPPVSSGGWIPGDGTVVFPDAVNVSVVDGETIFDFGFGDMDGRDDGIGEQEWKYGSERSPDGLVPLVDGTRWGFLPSIRVTPDTRKAFEGAMIVASLVSAAISAARGVLDALERAIIRPLRPSRTTTGLGAAERELAEELTDIAGRAGRRQPATVIGAESLRTGEAAAGRSVPGKTGCCAEMDAAGKLGGNPKDIRFTKPVRPRTGGHVDVCKKCQETFDPSQFPPGTKFE